MNVKPQHKHDCSACEFLGQNGTHDLYRCFESGDEEYIVRFGDERPDYFAMSSGAIASIVRTNTPVWQSYQKIAEILESNAQRRAQARPVDIHVLKIIKISDLGLPIDLIWKLETQLDCVHAATAEGVLISLDNFLSILYDIINMEVIASKQARDLHDRLEPFARPAVQHFVLFDCAGAYK